MTTSPHHPAAPPLDAQAVERILAAAASLASSSDLDDVLARIIDALRDTLDAERASVFQHDPEAAEFFATRAHGLPKSLRLAEDAGILGKAAAARGVISTADAYADPAFNRDVDALTGFRTRCLLTVPLLDHDDKLVGIAQVLNKRSGPVASCGWPVFTARDEAIAAHLAAQAAIALRRAALLAAERRGQQLEADVAIARRIQLAALADDLPEIPGYDLAAVSRPADAAGGDAYDVLATDDPPGAMLFMADAAGHGVGPALSVTHALAMLRMGRRLGADYRTILGNINDQLADDLPTGRFVTAFLGLLDTRGHTIDYVAAGHAPSILVRAGSPDPVLLGATAMPLGVESDLRADAPDPVALGPGDMLILLSDGYHEPRDASGVPVGAERIARMAYDHIARPAAEILAGIDELVAGHLDGASAPDDQTAIIIKRLP